MRRENQSGEMCYRMKEGFSLVEVIIAISILVILALPILAYFTNAAVFSSRGKSTQKANLAAQTVVEDLNACDTLDQVETGLSATGAAVLAGKWSVVSAYDTTTKTMELKREDIEIDSNKYTAKVKLDYNGVSSVYRAVGGTVEYNLFNAPALSTVYSDNNVVFAESGRVNASNEFVSEQEDEAVSNFLYTHPAQSSATIKSGMTRVMHLTLTEKTYGSTTLKLYEITAYYEYTYDGETSQVYLGRQEIRQDKLEKIYLFYNTRKNHIDEEEKIYFDVPTGTDLSAINVYFVCQQDPATGTTPASSVPAHANYKVLLTGTGNYTSVKKYYSNIDFSPSSGSVTRELSLTGKKFDDPNNIKRIAKITVDVYDQSDATKETLVHLETSKGD